MREQRKFSANQYATKIVTRRLRAARRHRPRDERLRIGPPDRREPVRGDAAFGQVAHDTPARADDSSQFDSYFAFAIGTLSV